MNAEKFNNLMETFDTPNFQSSIPTNSQWESRPNPPCPSGWWQQGDTCYQDCPSNAQTRNSDGTCICNSGGDNQDCSTGFQCVNNTDGTPPSCKRPPPSSNDSQLNQVKSNILNAQSKIDKQNSEIEKKAQQLEQKQKQIYGQSQEIEDKIKLLDTRNKMLQLSIEKNIYKKKVIYTLMAVILGLIIAMLALYSFFKQMPSVA